MSPHPFSPTFEELWLALQALSASAPFWVVFGLALFYARCRCMWRAMKVIAVIDGDTIEVASKRRLFGALSGKRYRLRLRGVDAPEMSQANGRAARDFVKGLVANTWVGVRIRGKDSYRRFVADIRTAAGADLAGALVDAGFAYVLPERLGLRGRELRARVRGAGVWKGFIRVKPWKAFSRTHPLLYRLLRRRPGRRRP